MLLKISPESCLGIGTLALAWLGAADFETDATLLASNGAV
jgi:hypothetical protein